MKVTPSGFRLTKRTPNSTTGVREMEVTITARQEVMLSKVVDMSAEDFAEYERLTSGRIGRAEDDAILRIANKYDFDRADNQIDWDTPDEITFEPAPNQHRGNCDE